MAQPFLLANIWYRIQEKPALHEYYFGKDILSCI